MRLEPPAYDLPEAQQILAWSDYHRAKIRANSSLAVLAVAGQDLPTRPEDIEILIEANTSGSVYVRFIRYDWSGENVYLLPAFYDRVPAVLESYLRCNICPATTARLLSDLHHLLQYTYDCAFAL